MMFAIAAVLVFILLRTASIVECSLQFVQAQQSKVFQIYSGKDLVLKLKVKAQPVPTKYELKMEDGRTLYEYLAEYKMEKPGQGVVILTIKEVLVGYDENYVFTIKNDARNSLEYRFTIKVLTVDLQLKEGFAKNSSYTAMIGVPFRLEIEVKGLPYPIDMRMNKTGERLSKGSYSIQFVRHAFAEGTVAIEIKKVEQQNAGLYTAIIYNEIGDSLFYKFKILTPEQAHHNKIGPGLLVVGAIVIPWTLAGCLFVVGAFSLIRKSRQSVKRQTQRTESDEFEEFDFSMVRVEEEPSDPSYSSPSPFRPMKESIVSSYRQSY